ncbi:hypothetical protein, partial [Mycobacterium sp. 852002-51152_SCH6134967]|uniref:hypothetical protein n=1 Tax=Mycobacterium sp. 852002-51152_SCH6134967 TaxID=1834096 RepID=UPI000A95F1CB
GAALTSAFSVAYQLPNLIAALVLEAGEGEVCDRATFVAVPADGAEAAARACSPGTAAGA